MRNVCIAACLVLLVAAVIPPVCSANVGESSQSLLPYTLTPLGFLTEFENASMARGINDLGQVVGTSIYGDGQTAAVLWDGGGIQTLGTLGGNRREAWSINESGQIAGRATNADGNWRAFRYDSGTMVALDHIRPAGWDVDTNGGAAYAINNSGDVAGIAYWMASGVDGPYTYAVKWAGTGTSSAVLDTNVSHGRGINEAGDVAGWLNAVACFWDSDGVRTSLGTLGGAGSWAYAINDSRQVVGLSRTADVASVHHAFLWDNGNMQTLGGLSGHNWSWATGINESGVVVGTSAPDGNTPGRAFIWKDGIGMLDMNDYLDGPYAGWTLTHAHAINNNGQIVGWGTNPQGKTEAFVLTPVPEPTSLLVLAVGITGLLARRRK